MKSIRKPPYESSKVSYKPSGIEWLGEIPQHWEVRRLKYLFYISKEESRDEFPNVLSLTQNGIIERDITTNKGQLAQNYIGYNIVKRGDIILNPMDLSSGYVAKSTFEGVISQAYIKIRPLETLNLSYYESFFQNLYHYKILWHLGKGISYDHRWTLGNDVFLNIKIPLPPLQEQKAIAEFLDKKCDKISQFIESKQKLITLLQEKKQALINECVTKGVNCYTKHNVESRPLRGAQKEKDSRQYKNSGVEYLGTIPKHWEVRRLASFGKFSKGGNIGRNDLLDEGISTLIYGDIYTKYEIKTHTLHSKVSQETAKNATPIYKGDILFSGSGETKEDIGKNIVYLGDEKAFAGGDVIIFRQNQNDALFLSYALNTQGVRFCKLIESKGEIIVHIYASNLRDIKIPLPPLQEQKAIASYLDTQITKIDLAIEKTKQQIALIKEYKTSLINQAVCGRIQLKD